MIGIYGESFAVPIFARSKLASEESWINNLGDKATSYGFAGTSILWSYWQFLENHAKCDRNIFLVSHPQRADHFGHPNNNFISTFHVAEAMLKNKGIPTGTRVYHPQMPKEGEDRVRAFRDYYLYIQNDKVDSTYADLILKDIIHRRPDTLIIPIDSAYPKLNPSVTVMRDYVYLQFKSLFPNAPKGADFESIYSLYIEVKTVNHLTIELNQLVAEHVKLSLAGQDWKDWKVRDMSPIIHNLPLDYYFEKIKR
jgi:hypothetical protein